MSVPSYHMHFKALTGSTPIQYVKAVRLHEARLMIARRDKVIADVAASLGYASSAQLSRDFKRHFRRTASEEAGWMCGMANLSTTSDDILTCARSLIVAGGYNGFSYADIAEVVGIRKASIHHHFPSKSDLVRTLVARYREDAKAALADLVLQVSDPLEQLRRHLGYWEAFIADATAPFCVCALLASQLPVLPEEIALEVRAHFRALSDWLATAMESGACTIHRFLSAHNSACSSALLLV